VAALQRRHQLSAVVGRQHRRHHLFQVVIHHSLHLLRGQGLLAGEGGGGEGGGGEVVRWEAEGEGEGVRARLLRPQQVAKAGG
jgi:hypothetical protein